MNATTTQACQRPNLHIESESRRGCRNNLVGLQCEVNGQHRTILATAWSKDSRLIVKVLPGGTIDDYLDASEVVLVSRWPFACCRGRLQANGYPRPKRGAK